MVRILEVLFGMPVKKPKLKFRNKFFVGPDRMDFQEMVRHRLVVVQVGFCSCFLKTSGA
jgi:hypothetical protein